MKVALCLYGLLGGTAGRNGAGGTVDPEQGYQAYHKNLFQHVDTDVFIHSWNVEHQYLIDSLYKPKLILCEPQEPFDGVSYRNFGFHNLKNIIEEEGNRLVYEARKKSGKNDVEIEDEFNRLVFRASSRWLSTYKSLSLKSRYEKEAKLKYDFVVSSRFDIALHKPIDFSSADPNYFYAKYRYKRNDFDRAFYDLIFFGGSDVMDKFGSLYDNLYRLKIRPPWACRAHIEELKVPHRHYDFHYHLLRNKEDVRVLPQTLCQTPME